MTQPPLSLLVLAWDDADPGAHPATAPATLPVLRQLAAHQPLLAVLPELPAEVQTTEYQAEVDAQQAAATTKSAAAVPVEDAEQAASNASAFTEVTSGHRAGPGAALGTVLLPLTAAAAGVATSRIVGLADLGYSPTVPTAAPAAAAAGALSAPAIPVPLGSTLPGNPVLPPALATFIHTAPRPAGPRAAPAAPYLGSSPPASPPEAVGSTEAADLQSTAAATPENTSELGALEAAAAVLPHPASELTPAVDLSAPPSAFEPAAPGPGAGETAASFHETPTAPTTATPPPVPDAFAQTAAEVGPEEAADLYAPEDNLTLAPEEADSSLVAPPLPAAPARASLGQALHALQRPVPEPAPDLPPAFDQVAADLIATEPLTTTVIPPVALSDNLHYRIIQYARFATHVAGEQPEEFGAIYAPNWPTWLAALEIRYRSRRPLVLHLTELAAATAPPAERGWRLELERYALRRAHTILVATDALRRQLLRHYGHLPGRLRVIAPDDEAGINAILAKVGTVADF